LRIITRTNGSLHSITLVNLNSQVQDIQQDVDYQVPYLQQQILDLNAVSEFVNVKDTITLTRLTCQRLLVADLVQQNEHLMRQNQYLVRQNARICQELETCEWSFLTVGGWSRASCQPYVVLQGHVERVDDPPCLQKVIQEARNNST
jgi:hypothetical protein